MDHGDAGLIAPVHVDVHEGDRIMHHDALAHAGTVVHHDHEDVVRDEHAVAAHLSQAHIAPLSHTEDHTVYHNVEVPYSYDTVHQPVVRYVEVPVEDAHEYGLTVPYYSEGEDYGHAVHSPEHVKYYADYYADHPEHSEYYSDYYAANPEYARQVHAYYAAHEPYYPQDYVYAD